jgi:hypothetical protein
MFYGHNDSQEERYQAPCLKGKPWVGKLLTMLETLAVHTSRHLLLNVTFMRQFTFLVARFPEMLKYLRLSRI